MKYFLHVCLLVFLLSFSRFSAAQNQWEHFNSGNMISALLVSGDNLWIGANQMLTKKNLLTGAVTNYTAYNSPLPFKGQFREIYDLAEDISGNLWIGTSGGLVKFDGYNWTIYDTANSGIAGMWVQSIEIDQYDRLWLGCRNAGYGAGISCFDGIIWTNYDESNAPICVDASFSLAFDKNNVLWVATQSSSGTTNAGLIHFDGTSWYQDLYGPGKYAWSLAIDTNDVKWFYSSDYDGLTRYSGTNFTSYNYFNSVLPALSVNSVYVDKITNEKWMYWSGFSPDQGLAKFDDSNWTIYNQTQYPYPGYYALEFAHDSSGALWIGTQLGLVRKANSTWSVEYLGSISKMDVWDIAIDNQHRIWTAQGHLSNDISLAVNDGLSSKVHSPHNTTLPLTVRNKVVCDNNGIVWTCSFEPSNSQLLKFDGNSWSSVSTGAGYVPINDLLADNQNNIWFSSYHSIGKYDGLNFTWYDSLAIPELAGESPQQLALDSSGQVCCLTYIGIDPKHLLVFDGTAWTSTDLSTVTPLNGRNIRDFEIDRQNVMWFCTDSGLVSFDGATSQIFTTSNSGITANLTSCIAFDSQNNKWIGVTRQYAGDVLLIKYDGASWIAYDTLNSEIQAFNCISDLVIDTYNNKYIATEFELAIFNENGIEGIGSETAMGGVSGKIWFDQNANETQDAGESGLAHQPVLILPDSLLTYSNPSGNYSSLLHAGAFSLAYDVPSNWMLTTDSSSYLAQVGQSQQSGFDFGANVVNAFDSIHADVCLTLARCSTNVPCYITYWNKGTTVLSGTVALTFNSAVSYSGGLNPPDSISGQTLFWNFTGLNPFEERQLTVYLFVTAAVLDTVALSLDVSNAAQILLSAAEESREVRCSFDPNEKTVSPQGIESGHFASLEDTFTYVVHFQNLGNDTAFSILIIDTLDANLDPNTFEFISSSHPCFVQLTADGQLTFRFDPVLLPYKDIDEPGSMGFVKYRIRPVSGLPEFTVVSNTAHIRFDYNPLIQTNTVFNTLVSSFTLGTPVNKPTGGCFVYPNPSHNFIYIDLDSRYLEKNCSIQIYDLTGRIVLQQNLQAEKSGMNVTALSPDLYFYCIQSGNEQVARGKFCRN